MKNFSVGGVQFLPAESSPIITAGDLPLIDISRTPAHPPRKPLVIHIVTRASQDMADLGLPLAMCCGFAAPPREFLRGAEIYASPRPKVGCKKCQIARAEYMLFMRDMTDEELNEMRTDEPTDEELAEFERGQA